VPKLLKLVFFRFFLIIPATLLLIIIKYKRIGIIAAGSILFITLLVFGLYALGVFERINFFESKKGANTKEQIV